MITGPGGALFLASFGAWGLLELWLVLREGLSAAPSPLDRRSRQGMFFSSIAAIVVAPALSALPVLPFGQRQSMLALAGLLIAGGVALRLWAVLTLGRYFRLDVRADPDQPVVSSGPFAVIRHPSYAAMLVILIGYGLAWGTALTVAATISVFLPALLRRIRLEETALVDILGDRYRVYAARTWRLVPGIW